MANSVKGFRPRRFRFSLAFLLLLVTLCAAAAHYVAAPRQIASRFATAIDSGDFAAAERLCVEHSRGMLRRWLKDNFEQPHLAPTAQVATWGGRRDISVGFRNESGSWDMSPRLECYATRSGVEIRMATP